MMFPPPSKSHSVTDILALTSMKAMKFLLAGLGAVLALLLWSLLSGSPPLHEKPDTPNASAPRLPKVDWDEPPLAGTVPADARQAVALAEQVREELAALVTELTVLVHWKDDKAAEGINVAVRQLEDAPWMLSRGLTDASGAVSFRVRPGRLIVATDRKAPETVELAEGEAKLLTIVLPAGNAVEGLVITRERTPVQGASILLYDAKSACSPSIAAHSDAEGRFLIQSVRLGMSELCAQASFYTPSSRIQIQSRSPGYTHKLELVLGEPGGMLRGHVTDRAGEPIAQAEVQVGDWPLNDGPVTRSDGTDVAPYLPRSVVSNSDGVFVSEGLASGPQSIRVRAKGYGYWSSDVNVPLGQEGLTQVVLDPEAIVGGTIRDSDGKPVSEVIVYRQMAKPLLSNTLLTHSRSDGTFELAGLPAGPNELVARKGNAIVSTTIGLVAGSTMSWNPTLDLGLVLSGHLTIPEECRQAFVVNCWDLSTGRVQSEFLEGSGDFTFYGLAPGAHQISVQTVQSGLDCFHQETSPGEAPLDVHIDCSTLPSSRIKGQVLWAEGEVGDVRVVPIGPGLENYIVWHRTRSDGTFEIGPYLPGIWHIEIRKGETNKVLARTGMLEIAPTETLDLGVIEINGE